MEKIINPILFQLGFLRVPVFSALITIAVLLYIFLAWKRAKEEAISPEHIFDIVFISAFTALLGGRIHYILTHFDKFGTDIVSYFALTSKVGISFLGMVLGGLIGIFIYTQKRRWSFGKTSDLLILGLPLAQIFGSIGCLFSSCAYGRPSRLPWAIELPGLIDKRHPSQIYEAIIMLVVFIILLKVSSKKRAPGYLTLLYLIMWSGGRFILEFTRGDSVYWGTIKSAYIESALILLVSTALFLLQNKKELKELLQSIIKTVKTKTHQNI